MYVSVEASKIILCWASAVKMGYLISKEITNLQHLKRNIVEKINICRLHPDHQFTDIWKSKYIDNVLVYFPVPC